jgi:hypothetical protein
VGVEERRADGGSVRSLAGIRWDALSVPAALLAAFALTIFSSACSRQKPEMLPDPARQLQAVPAADPAKVAGLQEAKHWMNPYVVVRTEEVGLLTGVAANEEQILKPGEVVKALAQLPASAWPYGRAVAILVDEKATSSEQDKAALRRNRGIVAGQLESAQVTIHWIPAS